MSIAGKGGTVSHVISDQLLHIQTAFQSFSVHSGRIYMHSTFRSGIGTVPYRYRCGRELNLAAFPEPHKIAETGFITLASHSVHKCVTATFMLFRTTHHFNVVIEYRIRSRVELGIDQSIRQFHHLSRTDLPHRVSLYVEIHRVCCSRSVHPNYRQQCGYQYTVDLHTTDWRSCYVAFIFHFRFCNLTVAHYVLSNESSGFGMLDLWALVT